MHFTSLILSISIEPKLLTVKQKFHIFQGNRISPFVHIRHGRR